MAGDGLGMSGAGAGMFSRILDVGLELGTTYGKKTLGIETGANQASRLGLTEQQLTAAPGAGQLTVSNQAGMDQKTLLIIAAVIVAAVLLTK